MSNAPFSAPRFSGHNRDGDTHRSASSLHKIAVYVCFKQKQAVPEDQIKSNLSRDSHHTMQRQQKSTGFSNVRQCKSSTIRFSIIESLFNQLFSITALFAYGQPFNFSKLVFLKIRPSINRHSNYSRKKHGIKKSKLHHSLRFLLQDPVAMIR